jgi:hypothetical protein
MTQQKNETVDYPQAKAALSDARKAWVRYGKTGERTTVTVVTAVLAAIQSGYLRDGREKDRPEGTITKGALADQFSKGSPYKVTASLVTYWQTMAHAMRVGCQPGSPLWGVLTGSRHVAQKGDVSKAAPGWQTEGDIVATIKAAGLNPETGEKVGTTSPSNPRGVDGKDTTGRDAHESDETPVAPMDAAKAAIKALGIALKSPTIQGDEYDTLRGMLTRMIAAEDRRRGLGATRKATTSKRKARKAA